jgi:salicylate hydroxylase
LTGDAAHPLLPFLAQGGAMAIEDAAVLAAQLPSPENAGRAALERSLKAYAAMRRARVRRVFKTARENAFAYHLPPLPAWLRDRRIGQLGPEGMRQRYAWLYDWRSPE